MSVHGGFTVGPSDLYIGPSDPETLLAALVAPLPPGEREAMAERRRDVRKFRQSDAGRIPTRDLRHFDQHGWMGGGAWDAQRR